VVEDPLIPRGSCCDAGRFQFGDCGAWWYNCPKWGLQNYSQWIQYGEYGFTMPTATEHQARCSYSAVKQVCDLTGSNCNRKMPRAKNEVCGETNILIKIPK
jgi:hypothetical protein